MSITCNFKPEQWPQTLKPCKYGGKVWGNASSILGIHYLSFPSQVEPETIIKEFYSVTLNHIYYWKDYKVLYSSSKLIGVGHLEPLYNRIHVWIHETLNTYMKISYEFIFYMNLYMNSYFIWIYIWIHTLCEFIYLNSYTYELVYEMIT